MRHLRIAASALIAGSVLVGSGAVATAKEVVVKLWARADRSGPLRAGNIVAAAETMNAALKAAGARDARLTIFPDANHNSWDAAYSQTPELWTWLFAQRRTQR